MATRKAGWTETEEDPNPGRHHHGWGANLTHAGIHILTTGVLLAVAAQLLPDVHLTAAGTAVALAWIGATHSIIDRRTGVRWWMEHTGQSGYLAHGGALHVDQAAHVGLGLMPAAFILALV